MSPFATGKEKIAGGLEKMFTSYRITLHDDADPARSCFMIKRFSQLWALKHSIKTSLPKGWYSALSPFPQKKIFDNDTPQVISARGAQIATWFNSFNNVPHIFSAPLIVAFFSRSGVDDATATPSQLLHQQAPSSLSGSVFIPPTVSHSSHSHASLHPTPASLPPFSLPLPLQMALEMKPADRRGTSDPYCIVYLTETPAGSPSDEGAFLLARTPTHHQTPSPVWNFPVFVPLVNVNPAMLGPHAPPLIQIEIRHQATSKDTFLGVVNLRASDLGNCSSTISSQMFPLCPRPAKSIGAGRPPRIDLGITGSLRLSLRFGSPVYGISPSRPPVLESRRARMREKLKATLDRASFSAYLVPSELSLTASASNIHDVIIPHSSFVAPSASQSPPGTPATPYLFSFKITFHLATNLKEKRNPNPYLHLYLRSQKNANRTLVYRTAVAPKTLNPVWESSMVSPCIRSTDVLEWEIRSWKLGVSAQDELFGKGSLSFPPIGPLLDQNRIIIALGPASSDVTGSLCMSYHSAVAVLDRNAIVHDLFNADDHYNENYHSTPNYSIHAQNYGVSIPNFRFVPSSASSFFLLYFSHCFFRFF